MSGLEDRLRDAYASEADQVTPWSLARLGDAITAGAGTGRTARRRLLRLLTPIGAAAAVTAIILLATQVLPGLTHSAKPSQTAGPAGPPRFLIVADATPLVVRNAATGAVVARIPVPYTPNTYVGDVTTRNGRDFMLAMYRPGICRSWLYTFRLNASGKPSPVTRFAPRPTVPAEVYSLTISADGQMVGYATVDCPSQNPHPGPSIIAVTNAGTGKTKQWTVPGVALNGVSLSADASQLSYSLQDSPAVVRVFPTSSASGPAADRGRTVADATQGGFTSFAAISPDGRQVYYDTSPDPDTVQIRVVDLSTGHSRLIFAGSGKPGFIAADPSARYLLVQVDGQGSLKAAVLNLATGTLTYLPSAWLNGDGDTLAW